MSLDKFKDVPPNEEALVKLTRYVKTAEGARKYGIPIGSPIRNFYGQPKGFQTTKPFVNETLKPGPGKPKGLQKPKTAINQTPSAIAAAKGKAPSVASELHHLDKLLTHHNILYQSLINRKFEERVQHAIQVGARRVALNIPGIGVILISIAAAQRLTRNR